MNLRGLQTGGMFDFYNNNSDKNLLHNGSVSDHLLGGDHLNNFSSKYNTRRDINTNTKDSIGLGLSDLSGVKDPVELGKSFVTNSAGSNDKYFEKCGFDNYNEILAKQANRPSGMYGRTGYSEYLGSEEQGGANTSGNLGSGVLKTSPNFNRSVSSDLYEGKSKGQYRDELTNMNGSLTTTDGKTISRTTGLNQAYGAGLNGGTNEGFNAASPNEISIANAAKFKNNVLARQKLNFLTRGDVINNFKSGQSSLARMFQSDEFLHNHFPGGDYNLYNPVTGTLNNYFYNRVNGLPNDNITKAYQDGVSDGQYAGIVGSDIRGLNGGHSYFGRNSNNYHNFLSTSITDSYGALKDGYKGYLIGRRYRGVSHGGLDGRGGHGTVRGVSNAIGKYVGTLNGGLDGRIGYGKWVGGFLTDGKYVGDQNFGLGRSYGYGAWVGDNLHGGRYAVSFHGRMDNHVSPSILGGGLSAGGIYGVTQYGGRAGLYGRMGGQYGGFYGRMGNQYGSMSGLNGSIQRQHGKFSGQFNGAGGNYGGVSGHYNQVGGYNGVMVRQNL